MSSLDDVFSAARKLPPWERMQLIARLRESVAEDELPPLDDSERVALRRKLIESDLRWMEPVPWPVVERLMADCSRSSRRKTYSAPRRFDLATLFVVTIAFSLLLGLMSGIGLPQAARVVAGGFILLVALGQAVLFGGNRPRAASVWIGAILYSIPMLATLFSGRMFAGSFFNIGMQFVVGGALGYLAGALVGAVFLVADVLRGRYRLTTTPTDRLQRNLLLRHDGDLWFPIVESPSQNKAWDFLFDPRDTSKLFSAPRQIDLATVFVIMAAYSVVFGALSLVDRLLSLGMQPGMTIMVGGMLTFVALGQAFYFGRANPRGVSIIVGMLWYTAFSVALAIVYPRVFGHSWFIIAIINGLVFGVFLGYIAGVLVGGMFLLADELRTRFARASTSNERSDTASPFDDEPNSLPDCDRAGRRQEEPISPR